MFVFGVKAAPYAMHHLEYLLMREKIGALSLKTCIPLRETDSTFHAGPSSQDTAAPPIKPPT